MLERSVEDLIVHRGTMRWIDQVEPINENHLVARTTIDGRFSTVDQLVPAMNCIELMAQTAGALVGEREAKNGVAPPFGFLVAVRSLDLHVDALDRGTELEVSASLVFSTDSGGVFACEVRSAERLLASGQLTIYREPNSEGDSGEAAS